MDTFSRNTSLDASLMSSIVVFLPFALNSSPIATPRAFIRLLLQVWAALIAGGKPVTLLPPSLIPAGPSFKQSGGIVIFWPETTKERDGGVMFPMQRPRSR